MWTEDEAIAHAAGLFVTSTWSVTNLLSSVLDKW